MFLPGQVPRRAVPPMTQGKLITQLSYLITRHIYFHLTNILIRIPPSVDGTFDEQAIK